VTPASDPNAAFASPLTREPSPLALHIVGELGSPDDDDHEDATKQIRRFVERLCAELSTGERAAGVPVRLWGGVRKDGLVGLPPLFDCARADKTLIVALVDQRLFESRFVWRDYFKALSRKLRADRDLLIPVAIHADAARVCEEVYDLDDLD
jgi:hypothetical protein